MQVDNSFFDYLAKEEGFKECPYLDSGGVATIGIGTTIYPDGTKVKMTDSCIKFDKATEYIKYYIKLLESVLSGIQRLNQNQYNALISLGYNIGDDKFESSTLLKFVISNPNDPRIRDQFMRWVYDNGKVVKGLVNRRTSDANLYFS